MYLLLCYSNMKLKSTLCLTKTIISTSPDNHVLYSVKSSRNTRDCDVRIRKYDSLSFLYDMTIVKTVWAYKKDII